ncbi:MAG: hypothetical protein ACYDAC_12700 [Candidatus Dormibacteria bacterium]
MVAAEVSRALDRQHDYFHELDVKASFVVAGTIALLGGVAAVGRWPSNPHAQDLAGAAVAVLLLSLLAGAYTWFPRRVNAVPNPLAAAVQLWEGAEHDALARLTAERVRGYEANRAVEIRKLIGLRVAIVCLPAAVILGLVAIVLNSM